MNWDVEEGQDLMADTGVPYAGGSRMLRRSLFVNECEPKTRAVKEPSLEEIIEKIIEDRVKAAECETEGITAFLGNIQQALMEDFLKEKDVKLILSMMYHVENCDRL